MPKLKLKQDVNGFWRFAKNGYYMVGSLDEVMLYALDCRRNKQKAFTFVLKHQSNYEGKHRKSDLQQWFDVQIKELIYRKVFRKPTAYENQRLDDRVEQWHLDSSIKPLAEHLRLNDEEYSYFATYNLIPHDWLNR